MQAMIGAAQLSVCHEQAKLLDIRSKAAELYARAADDLADFQRKIHFRDDYVACLEAVRVARAEVERARHAFATHRKDHGC
jgi:dTDP-4-amino-4,6-dideoxygalactose transaminase